MLGIALASLTLGATAVLAALTITGEPALAHGADHAEPASSAQAAEGDGFERAPDEFVLEGVGPGECHPAEASIGTDVECRFPLIGRIQNLADWQLPVTVDLSPGFVPDAFDRRPCRFEIGELRCSGISEFFEPGEVSVSLELDGRSRELASFFAVDSFESSYFTFLEGGLEPVAWPGRAVRLTTWRNDVDAEMRLWAVIERRAEGPARFTDPFEFVDAREVDVPQPGQNESVTTDLVSPAVPGRYVISMCEGPTASTCSVIPGHHPFQVIDPTLREVVAGHNRSDGVRVNLVFVGADLPRDTRLQPVVERLLGLEGPLVSTFDGPSVPLAELEPGDPGSDGSLSFGPFAIEPLASAADRFNFWIIDDELEDSRALFHNAEPEFSTGRDLDGFDLDHVSVVALHHQVTGRFARSEALWPSFTGQELTPDTEDIEFAGVYLAVDVEMPEFAAQTLAHEFGHSLFDLRDEYSEFGRQVVHGYPNCADGVEQAEQWWGDLVGAVDPFVDEYFALTDGFDLFVYEDLREWVTIRDVGSVTGGCYDGGGSTIRPSSDSLMNSEVPVFGAVNRRRVEAILDQFEPRVELSSTADVSLRCFPAASIAAGEPVRCSGALARFVDPGVEALLLATGDASVECAVDEVDSEGVRGVSCPELVVSGEGPWSIAVSIGNGAPAEVTRLWPLREQTDPSTSGSDDEPATVTTSVDGEEPTSTLPGGEGPTSTITGDGSVSRGWALVAGLGALIVVGLGGWWFQRASARADVRRDDDR